MRGGRNLTPQTQLFTDTLKNVHISTIRPGDTVEHNDKLMTVCANDIKRSEFMGVSLFGDSYHCGHKPVKKAVILTP